MSTDSEWLERVRALPPAKRALLEELTRRRAAASAKAADPLADVELLRAGEPDPIVLAHPIGGSLFCYVDLCRALGPGRAVWGVAAGTALTEPADFTMEQLARRYVAGLTAADVTRPAVIAGWSFGGLLAYEMARQYQTAGTPPVLLIDSVPWPESTPPWDQEATLRTFTEYLLGLAGENPDVPIDPALWRLPVPDALVGAARAVRDHGANLGLSGAELPARYWRYANAAHAMCGYRPGGYAGPVTLLRTADTAAEAAPWPAGTGSSLTVVHVPGDHYSVLRPPVVDSVAQALAEAAVSSPTRPGRCGREAAG
jgi:thioesterase domain-containing protein